jgi:transcriptional regulator of acetoin/glycerol metabolism
MSLETKAVESPVSSGNGAATLEEVNRVPKVAAPVLQLPPAHGPLYGCPPGCVLFKVGQKLADVEREMILRTMDMTRGNRTRAAKFLGISVRTLYTKLLEIDKENALRAAKAPEGVAQPCPPGL